jgi:hypothetical protein
LELTLYYRGELASGRTDREHKHAIRCCFHDQLSIAAAQPPLHGVGVAKREIRKFHFAAIVCDELKLVAELHVVLLRPGPPGYIVRGGDIDNRMKTLFDSLSVPQENALPDGALPSANQDPFWCLLEDDSRITKVSVETHSLFEEPKLRNEVVLLVHVRMRATQSSWDNIGIG